MIFLLPCHSTHLHPGGGQALQPRGRGPRGHGPKGRHGPGRRAAVARRRHRGCRGRALVEAPAPCGAVAAVAAVAAVGDGVNLWGLPLGGAGWCRVVPGAVFVELLVELKSP